MLQLLQLEVQRVFRRVGSVCVACFEAGDQHVVTSCSLDFLLERQKTISCNFLPSHGGSVLSVLGQCQMSDTCSRYPPRYFHSAARPCCFLSVPSRDGCSFPSSRWPSCRQWHGCFLHVFRAWLVAHAKIHFFHLLVPTNLCFTENE